MRVGTRRGDVSGAGVLGLGPMVAAARRPLTRSRLAKCMLWELKTLAQNLVSGHMHIKRMFAPDILLDISGP
jgi:hypothetical protein